MHEPRDILVVDDDPAIRALLVEILSAAGHRLGEAMSASAALARLRERSVDLVVSDINMPGMDGVDLLREVKALRPDTEVVMLTALSDLETAMRTMRLGAIDYLTKPFNIDQVGMTIARALEHRDLVLENRAYREGLEKRVAERTAALERKTGETEDLYRRLNDSYQTTLEALATALDTRDAETLGHSVRVASYAVTVAERMGVAGTSLTDIYRGALLHDVGKIGIPDAILRKPGKLNAAEWHEMRKHPEIGARMLQGIRFLQGAVPIVLCHQERWDGKGYPQRLQGEAIPLGARIFAVVDTLDAMTSDRPYRRALSYDTARAEIVRFSGTQFDPGVVQCFLGI
ncbi:MAG TPA: HD domain-containing phosphohydrolase, partial [Candidatus Polarisedimenticolia bacterium]|nr:HD domain-containing phosphohydrolase [Candidatus Polarisedimenticolia bacterium]